jgi:dihydroflavonol-4-reductase
MTVLVTGATGTAGYNLVLEIIRNGGTVRAFLRNNDPFNALLADLPVERAFGDLRDPNALRQAMKGCHAAYHAEEKNPFGYCRPEEYHETNVKGTRNVFQSALERKVQRVVHLSSAYTTASGAPNAPADEQSPFNLGGLNDPYIESKREAEGLACDYGEKGLEVVILNPGLLMGAGNQQPSLGRTLLRFTTLMAHAIPGGATLLSDARDMARAAMIAMRLGVPGERYLVGTRSLRYNEIMAQVDAILGVHSKEFYMPRWIALLIGRVTDAYARIRGKPVPFFPSVSTIHRMYVDLFVSPEKATILWGINWTPIGTILESSIQWLRENRLM